VPRRSVAAGRRPQVVTGPLRILTDAADLAPLGGVEQCTQQDVQALVGRGHRVSVMYSTDGVHRAAFEAADVAVHGPYAFGFEPRRAVTNIVGFVEAARRARRLRPDVLWLNRPEHIVWAQFVARWARIPIVCHLHHAPNYRRVRLVMAGVAHFIAVSEFERQVWIAAGLHPERISVVYNSIAQADYPWGGADELRAARDVLGLPQNGRVVVFYGRIMAEKGIFTLLESWREIARADAEALLVVVGSIAPADRALVDAALALLPETSYRIFPLQGDVVPFLHAADVVVVPSLKPESFGRTVLEALATGRPVIGSRDGAVPEILSGAMQRFLVDATSASQLSAQISTLLDWRTSEPGLGAECRSWFETKFPHAVHVAELESVLRTYSKSPSRPRSIHPRVPRRLSDEARPLSYGA